MSKRLQEVYFRAPTGDAYVTLNGVVVGYHDGDDFAIVRVFHTHNEYKVPLSNFIPINKINLNTGLEHLPYEADGTPTPVPAWKCKEVEAL